MACDIITQVASLVRAIYRANVGSEEQKSLIDQRSYKFLRYNQSRPAVREDKGWRVFEAHAPSIVTLAQDEQGRELEFTGHEDNERAMFYKALVAMFDTNTFLSVIFGGDNACVAHSRYMFTIILGNSLASCGEQPLVNLASLSIPARQAIFEYRLAPTVVNYKITIFFQIADHGPDKDMIVILTDTMSVNVIFDLPGYDVTILLLHKSQNDVPSPLPLDCPSDSPPLLTPPSHVTRSVTYFDKASSATASGSVSPATPHLPVLHATEAPFIGATGMAFRALAGRSSVIIKAIPGSWKGVEDLRHEAQLYKKLISLQGSIIPRCAGFFEGHGWSVLVFEDCGSAVIDTSLLSTNQRSALYT
ncbi:hypothetical protein MVEN_01230200 [Mycena venus]|uniref:Protein kinase domain-containing protein n=1 Tax=Mycena venus TaxID=2733690 RepID=A0A8H7CW92_9AGAR|nr:hypothetical protein MVEN_01230200 [Mycena venus]